MIYNNPDYLCFKDRKPNIEILHNTYLMAIIASIWVKNVFRSSFVILLISGILFFGVYLFILMFRKEPLVYEFVENFVKKLKMKGKK